jgi:hypothetical protein
MEGRVLEQEKKRSNWMRVDYIGSLCLGARTCIMAIFFRVIGFFQSSHSKSNQAMYVEFELCYMLYVWSFA